MTTMVRMLHIPYLSRTLDTLFLWRTHGFTMDTVDMGPRWFQCSLVRANTTSEDHTKNTCILLGQCCYNRQSDNADFLALLGPSCGEQIPYRTQDRKW